MKMRKLISLMLAFVMVAALIPALLVPASAATADGPVSFPGMGGDYYIDALQDETWTALNANTTGTKKYTTSPTDGNHRQEWYTASGITFEIKPTNSGTWAGDTTSTEDPYFCFNILINMAQTITKWTGNGAGNKGSTTDSGIDMPASFWFNDYGQGQAAYSPKTAGDKATAFYSDDNGATWKSVSQADTLKHKFSAINLAGLSTEGVLIYIPLEEFWFTGFVNGDQGIYNGGTEGMGVDCYYGDFRPFLDGVQWLKNNTMGTYGSGYTDALDRTSLTGINLTYRTANAFSTQWQDGNANGHARAAITASDIRLVYNVADETKVEKNGETYDASFFVNQPNTVSDQTVTATLNGANTTLTGVKQNDGRVKYTLSGLTEQNFGDKVTFTYTSATAGTKTAILTVKDPTINVEELETLPSSLNTTQMALGSSNLYKRSAVFAGDSLIAAARDSAAGGWSGRLATTYSMTNNKIGIGGKCLSDWRTNTGHNPIYTQINNQNIASQLKYNEEVDYVILDGGINDINRSGSVLGAVTPDGTYAFDVGTIMGGLEHAFAEARRVYPNATIGFVFLFQMPYAKSESVPDGLPCRDLEYTQEFVDAAIKVCEKWGVHYLNMFNDASFNELIDVANESSAYLDNADMLHLNAAGYALTAPYIAAWMETLPLSENSTATVYENLPTELPDSGEGFYGEAFGDGSASNKNLNFNAPLHDFNDWYKAEGVMFQIDATNAGRWHSNAAAVANDVYWCFDLALYMKQKVYGYNASGSKTNSYGVFWTNDNFYGEEQTGSLAGATSILYYSDDAGKTWKTATTGTSTSREGVGIYAVDLTDMNTENVWIYIPMTEFYYYGAYEGGAHGLGLTAYHQGFETLEYGITALEEAKAGNVGSTAYGTTARNFMVTNSTPSTVTLNGNVLSNCATAAVTISGIQFVYDVVDTASVTVENDLAMSIYAAEPENAAGLGNVSATLGGETYKLAGETQDDGRVKYTLNGILPQQIGDEIEFFWQEGKTGLGQKVTLSVKDYAEKLGAATDNAELKTLLDTMLHYGAEAQKFAGYKVNDLCNANAGAVTNVTVSQLTAPYSSTIGDFTSIALLLDGTMTLRFKVADGVTGVNYECADQSGALDIVDGYVYFSVYAHRAADAIKLTAEGAATSWTVSLNWYLQNVTAEDQLALVQAIANYTSAANAYVN